MMRVRQIGEYLVSVVRVFGIVASTLLLPWFFLVYEKRPALCLPSTNSHDFKLGVENLSSALLKSFSLQGDLSYAVGLVTNKTGIDQTGVHTADILMRYGLSLKKIFTPDTDYVINRSYKQKTSREKYPVPIVPLDKEHAAHALLEKHMHDVDVIFFDLQDSGVRYYRSISLLFEVIKIGSLYDKTIVVLDRPNMLGASIEGVLGENDAAFTDVALPVPVRYGMTIGELARYFNTYVLHKSARLYVVPMDNYVRKIQAEEVSARQLVSLNTHVDVMQSSNLLGILSEVHPIDVGVDTEYAYQCIMLPDVMHFPKQSWYELKSTLKKHGVESVWHTHYNAQSKRHMSGLRLVLPCADSFASFNALLSVLRFFKESGIRLTFSAHFDQALGTKKIREYMQGRLGWQQLEVAINKGLKNFFSKAQGAFLYKPFPKVMMV